MLSKFKGFEKDISLEISIILASLMHDYGSKALGFHPQVIHFIEMNKSCTDERNILTNKSKYRKNISFHLLIFADSG